MKKRKILAWLSSAGISAGLLWYLLSRITTDDLLLTFRNIHPGWLSAFAAAALFGAALRAWRYNRLLFPHSIRRFDILRATFIRNLFVDLLPARLGSLSYVYILNARMGCRFEDAASSFLISFLLDFVTLGPFLILAAFMVGIGTNAVSGPALPVTAAAFFLIFLLVLWRIRGLLSILKRLLHLLFSRTKLGTASWAETLLEKLDLIIQVLGDLGSRRDTLFLFAVSLAIRAMKYLSLYCLLVSLLEARGLGAKDISLWTTILGITGAEMTGALPVKGLGGFGTWETAWAFTFHQMNVPTGLAVITGVGVHLITNLFEYALGTFSLASLYAPKMFRFPFHSDKKPSRE